MKRKSKSKDRPERRRSQAEINLIGQKGSGPKAARRRGCAQMFGVFSVLAMLAAWSFALAVGPR